MVGGYEFYGLILGLFLFVILVVRGGRFYYNGRRDIIGNSEYALCAT